MLLILVLQISFQQLLPFSVPAAFLKKDCALHNYMIFQEDLLDEYLSQIACVFSHNKKSTMFYGIFVVNGI